MFRDRFIRLWIDLPEPLISVFFFTAFSCATWTMKENLHLLQTTIQEACPITLWSQSEVICYKSPSPSHLPYPVGESNNKKEKFTCCCLLSNGSTDVSPFIPCVRSAILLVNSLCYMNKFAKWIKLPIHMDQWCFTLTVHQRRHPLRKGRWWCNITTWSSSSGHS